MKKMALIVAMAVLVCWLPGQALADTIYTMDLSGVALVGGGTATGDLTYDATTQTITTFDITATQGTSTLTGTASPYTFSPSALSSATVDNELPGGLITLFASSSGDAGYPGYELELEIASFSDLSSPGTYTLKTGGASFYEVLASSSSIKSYNVSAGSLVVAAVPLPSSAFLLGSGLLGMALLGLRRKGTVFGV
ncbi:MAG: hypothetical protein ACLP7A_13830 [Desulfobaccales bacterium]